MIRPLYTVAFPQLAPADRAWLEKLRSRHDPAASRTIAAHVTLVFAWQELAEARYRDHLARVAGGTAPISFCLRYAMLGPDAGGERAHVFLVPEEGFSAVSRLHDRLYAGPLAPALRLDLPFVPHVTVATTPDRQQAKRLCDSLNAEGLAITGSLDLLTLVAVDAGRAVPFYEVALTGTAV